MDCGCFFVRIILIFVLKSEEKTNFALRVQQNARKVQVFF